MGTKNINILCNSTLGIPIISELIREGRVQSIAMPAANRDADAEHILTLMAQQVTIPLLSISKEKLEEDLAAWLLAYPCKAVICLTFPYKIPSAVLAMPDLGFINVHFALLPEYRGAQPIFWEIKNREPYGGITVHRMNGQWDEGNILFRHTVKILPHLTYGQHIGRLTRESIHLLPGLIKLIEADIIMQGEKQEQGNYKPKPVYQDVKLNWERDGSQDLMATIKACNPWNKGAYCLVNGMQIRIVDAETSDTFYGNECGKTGTIRISPDNTRFAICCNDGRFLIPLIIYTDEGFFTPLSLLNMGLQTTSVFH